MAATTDADEDVASSTLSVMPQWLDDNHIDPVWLKAKTGLVCTECVAEDVSNKMRQGSKTRDGATLRLTLVYSSSTRTMASDSQLPETLIVKQIPPQGEALAKQLGLAREAYFYQQHLDEEGILPKIFYASGDYEQGRKICIMEDLKNAIDSGILFGPGNPNNWNRDLPILAAKAAHAKFDGKPPSSAHVATVTFQKIAHIHAAYWKRADLLLCGDKTWLRGEAWIQGNDKQSWQASQDLIANGWKKYLGKEKEQTQTIRWDPVLRETVQVAVDGISWDKQLDRLNVKSSHWTLVHGDFWPGNVLWVLGDNVEIESSGSSSSSSPIRFIDWEMVGVGSGPQDLGQYIISNMDPAERRACERQLIESYYNGLIQCGSNEVLSSYSWDECWSEYRLGGFERWIWFLVWFLNNEMYDWAQFVHDQMHAFQKDHDIKPEEITQPRP